MMGKIAMLLVALIAAGGAWAEASAFEEDVVELERWYVGGAGTVVLPQGGAGMRRLGGASARFGYYLTEFWAVEGEAAWLENAAGLAAGALWHWWGYVRFDPFFTFGVRGWIRGDVGPKAGVGAFYHLTESLSLRFDADATLALDGETAMVYSVSGGLQWSF